MKYAIATLILGFSLMAEAQTSGFFVSALYSSANEVSYKGTVATPTVNGAFTATESTAGAFGFGGGYRFRQPGSFGFDVGAAYEFPRGSGGIRGTSGTNTIRGDYEGDVSTSLLSFVGNANFSIGTRFYVSGGVNYPLVFSSSTMKMQGLPGFQLGVGGQLTERFSLELDYRVLRMKGRIDVAPMNLTIEEASFPGFILSVHYSI